MLCDGFHDVPPGKVATIVTHLEMTAKAPLRGVPLPDGLVFEPLSRDHADHRDIIRRVGEDWLWFWRLVVDDASLTVILESPEVAFWTLSKDGRPEAILELDFRVKGQCELAFFGVTPQLVGTGAGAYLMDRAIEKAWQRPISRLHLHTCTLDSPQALGFYLRSGFTAYSRQVEIADDPRLIGIHDRSKGAHIPLIE